MVPNLHLFAGKSDINLSKLDSVFDLIIYDDVILGTDGFSTYELHTVAGALGAFCISLLFAYFNGEIPEAYAALMQNRIVGPLGASYGPVSVVGGFSVIFALRPYFLQRLVFTSSPFLYFCQNMFCQFLVIVISVLYMDVDAQISRT